MLVSDCKRTFCHSLHNKWKKTLWLGLSSWALAPKYPQDPAPQKPGSNPPCGRSCKDGIAAGFASKQVAQWHSKMTSLLASNGSLLTRPWWSHKMGKISARPRSLPDPIQQGQHSGGQVEGGGAAQNGRRVSRSTGDLRGHLGDRKRHFRSAPVWGLAYSILHSIQGWASNWILAHIQTINYWIVPAATLWKPHIHLGLLSCGTKIKCWFSDPKLIIFLLLSLLCNFSFC